MINTDADPDPDRASLDTEPLIAIIDECVQDPSGSRGNGLDRGRRDENGGMRSEDGMYR